VPACLAVFCAIIAQSLGSGPDSVNVAPVAPTVAAHVRRRMLFVRFVGLPKRRQVFGARRPCGAFGRFLSRGRIPAGLSQSVHWQADASECPVGSYKH
jgi:hypothetical protein